MGDVIRCVSRFGVRRFAAAFVESGRKAAAGRRTPRRFALLVGLFVACSSERPAATTTDDLGREIAVPARVERVIALAPNLTEIVFAIGAGEKLVAADDASNFPAGARALPKVGAMQPNVERIAALRPDLVLASSEGNHPNLAPSLAAAGIALYVVKTDRVDEIAPAMRRVGTLLGAPDSEPGAKQLERAVAAQRRKREMPPRVLFLIWTDPLYVAGRDTFTEDVIELTGAQNAVQVAGWPQYSLESLLASPPELILYPRGAVTPQQIEALRARVPELKSEIVAVDEDIFQRPGPRVAEAAARLNGILDAFEAARPR